MPAATLCDRVAIREAILPIPKDREYPKGKPSSLAVKIMAVIDTRTPTRDWHRIAVAIVGFWLSTSLVLDFLVMPVLYYSGMMGSGRFGSAGYLLFWWYNRLELVCGAALLVTALALYLLQRTSGRSIPVVVAILLLTIAISYTFWLTPYMSGLSFNPHLFSTVHNTIPAAMNDAHLWYWGLEAMKLAACAWWVQSVE